MSRSTERAGWWRQRAEGVARAPQVQELQVVPGEYIPWESDAVGVLLSWRGELSSLNCTIRVSWKIYAIRWRHIGERSHALKRDWSKHDVNLKCFDRCLDLTIQCCHLLYVIWSVYGPSNHLYSAQSSEAENSKSTGLVLYCSHSPFRCKIQR